MDLFGGRGVDRAQDSKRIREIQELIRTFAGNVDDNQAEMARVHEMMEENRKRTGLKAGPAKEPVAETNRSVEPVKAPMVRSEFCAQCGSVLPADGSGCQVCRDRKVKAAEAVPLTQPVPRPQPVRSAEPVPVPRAPPADRPVFCIHCGSRLPADSPVCPRCGSQRWRRCSNCGAWIRATDDVCPICHRTLVPELGRNRPSYFRH